MKNQEIVVLEDIKNKIMSVRGNSVLVDRDLAQLYGVETKRLNEAVKRNIKRFPADFMFQMTDGEKNELVANCDRGRFLSTYKTRKF